MVDREDDLTDATLLTFERRRENARRNHEGSSPRSVSTMPTAFVRSADILEGFWRDGTLGYGLISAAARARPALAGVGHRGSRGLARAAARRCRPSSLRCSASVYCSDGHA